MQKINLFITLVILFAVANSESKQIAQSFVGTEFSDADGWTIVQEFNPTTPIITECNGTKLFGGYNKFAARSIALKSFSIPPHHTLTLKVQVWKIDSWDNEEFYIWVDDNLVWKKNFQPSEGGTQICGALQGYTEAITNVELDIKHTGPTAVVTFTSNLNEGANNESWAIRDFRLYFTPCPANCSACSTDDTSETCNYWLEAGNSWIPNVLSKIESEGWEVSGGKAEGTQCGPLALFGGFDKTSAKAVVSRNFTHSGHFKLKIKLLMAKIDSWDNEEAQLKVDGTIVWKRQYQYNEGYFGRVCGSPNSDWTELFTRVEVDVGHTLDNIKIEFLTTLDEASTNESFGLRDFYLFVAKCADNCIRCNGPKPADCQLCSRNWVFYDGECRPQSNFILQEQSFMADQFTEIDGWIIKNSKGGATVSQCGGVSIIGGFDVFGKGASAEKSFKFPPHKRLRLQFQIFKIDSWDNEFFYATVDGVNVWEGYFTPQTGGINICGTSEFPDAKFRVDEIFDHSACGATVLFHSNLDEDSTNESWGFREFKISYEPNETCAILFTQFDYKGESFQFCGNSPNLEKANISPQIRSIRVPPQGRVTLYENADYYGRKVVYTEDQPRITQFEPQFAQVHQDQWIQLIGQ